MVAKKYEAAAHSDDDSQFQVYESAKQVQEFMQQVLLQRLPRFMPWCHFVIRSKS